MLTKWDDFRYFLAIARSRSLTAAANTLSVSQPTVSRHLNAMEMNMGVRLFDRTSDGYVLTGPGLDIFEDIIRLEEEFVGLERRIQGQDKRYEGSIRITCTEAMANLYLAKLLAEFVEQHPEIEISLVCTFQHLSLMRREADIALRTTFDPPDTLMGRKVARTAFSSYCAAQDGLHQKGGDMDPADWPWIGWQDETYNRMLITNFFPGARIVHRVDDMQVMRTMARCGLGAAVLPCYMGDTDAELKRHTPETMMEGTPDLWVLFHPDVRHVARFRLFTEFICDKIQSDRALFEGRLFE